MRTLFALLILVLSSAANAALEFSAYVRSNDAFQFVVTDLDTGTKSDWLVLGGMFFGHKVSSFDSKCEILVLKKDGEVLRLSLKNSQVKEREAVSTEKLQLKVVISPEGTFSIGGQPFSDEALEALLRGYAERSTPLSLFFQRPHRFDRRAQEAIGRLFKAAKRSGGKGWSITIGDAPPPTR